MSDAQPYKIDVTVGVDDQTAQGLAQAKAHVDAFQKSMQQSRKLMTSQMSRIQLTVSAIDKASPVIAKISSIAAKVGKTAISIPVKIVDLATAPFRKLLSFLSTPLGMLGLGGGLAGLTAGLVAIPLKLADAFNTAKLSFQQMLGTAQGNQFVSQLQNWGISSPFAQSNVLGWGRMLLGSGMSQQQALKTMGTLSDVSSYFGLGSQGMSTLNTAVGRMVATGRLDAGTLDMFTQFGVPIWDMLSKQTGMGRLSLQRMVGSGVMSTDQYLPMILDALNGKYGGATQRVENSTIGGLMTQITDLFNVKAVQSWGEGLNSIVIPKLQAINKWLGDNKDMVDQWSKSLQDVGAQFGGYIAQGIDWVKGKISDLVGSTAWQDATTLGQKIKLAWDQVVVQPFEQWWGTSGQTWVQTKATELGSTLGTFLSGALLKALGVDANGPFTKAGSTAGQAFWDGFSKSFDAGKVADAAKNKVVSAQPKALGGNSDSWLASLGIDFMIVSTLATLASKVPGVKFLATKALPFIAKLGGKGIGGLFGSGSAAADLGIATPEMAALDGGIAASAAEGTAAVAGGSGIAAVAAPVAAVLALAAGIYLLTKALAPSLVTKNGQKPGTTASLFGGDGSYIPLTTVNNDLQQFDTVIRDLTGLFTIWENKFSNSNNDGGSGGSGGGGGPFGALGPSVPGGGSTAAAASAYAGIGKSIPGGMPAAGDIAGWRNVIASQVPANLRNNAAFINTLLAGGLAESGLDPTRVQRGGGGRGFWQFDVNGGMGTGLSNAQLFSEQYQASKIIPEYAYWWQHAPGNLSGADKAAWVAAHAERPYDYQNPYSAANNNYRAAYGRVVSASGHTVNLHPGAVVVNAATSDPVGLAKQLAEPLMNHIGAALEKVSANQVN